MIEFFKKFKYRLLIFFAVFGPATIAAVADNDAAGVATYSLAGAKFGYSILFVLFIITFLLAVTQEMGIRIGLVTGKGLGDIIRERYGVVVAVLVFLLLAAANFGTIIANFSALKIVTQMFKIPTLPFLIFFILFAFLFVTKGSYKTNQRLFLFGVLFYFAYLFSAFKANPNWGVALKSLIFPTNIPFSKEFVVGAIALLGTTITPWGQFFVQSYTVDKKLTVDKLKYSQLETYFGAFLTDFFSFFMIVAVAAALFIHKINLVSGEQAALAIKPFAGNFASLLFGLGLLNAAMMGIVIISMTTAYVFAEFFGYEGSLDVPFERGRLFYGLFLLQLILAALVVMIPAISLFKIVFVTQFVNGMLLPIIFYFLLKIGNDAGLMREYINNRWYNYFIIGSSIIIIISTFIAIIGML